MELDIFLPQHKMAFEYNGPHHYVDIRHFGTTNKKTRKRDLFRAEECEKNEIVLVEVPYWWDKKKASLEATIFRLKNKNDGLFSSHATDPAYGAYVENFSS